MVWCWFNAPNAIETGRALCGARSSKLTPMRGHLTAGKYVDGLHGRALRRHWRTRGGAADAADGRGRRRRGHVCRGAQRLLVALLVDIRVTDMLGMEPRCIAGTPANPAKMPTALLRVGLAFAWSEPRRHLPQCPIQETEGAAWTRTDPSCRLMQPGVSSVRSARVSLVALVTASALTRAHVSKDRRARCVPAVASP